MLDNIQMVPSGTISFFPPKLISLSGEQGVAIKKCFQNQNVVITHIEGVEVEAEVADVGLALADGDGARRRRRRVEVRRVFAVRAPTCR